MDSVRSHGSGKNKVHPGGITQEQVVNKFREAGHQHQEDKGTKMKYLIDTNKKSSRILNTEDDEATGENGERLSTRQHLVYGDNSKTEGEDNKSDGNSDEESLDQAGQLQQTDQMLRKWVDTQLNEHIIGKYFQSFLSLISVLSSIALIILTYWDHSQSDPCCLAEAQEKLRLAEINGVQKGLAMEAPQDQFISSCMPRCDEYYNVRMPRWFYTTNVVIGFTFLLEYFLYLYISQNRLMFVATVENLANLFIIILPPIVFPYETGKFGMFMQSLSALSRLSRCIKIFTAFSESESDVQKKQIEMIVSLLFYIFMSAGIFMIIENFHPEDLTRGVYNFNTAVYFIMVTFSTIGYGDYYPVSDEGRIFMVVVILYVIVIKLPEQVNELIRLMTLKTPFENYTYRSNPEVLHVVITGQVQLAPLKNVTLELFHPDHRTEELEAIILQDQNPGNDMQKFLHDPSYQGRIKYLTGSPLNEKDLQRCDLSKAQGVVLMANLDSHDPEQCDHRNILIGLAMKKFVSDNCNGRQIKLCMHLIKQESRQHYMQSIGKQPDASEIDQVIIVEEIKMNLLSKSCLALGIISFLSNLISSSGDAEDDNANQFNQKEKGEKWKEQYVEGMGHEIYRCELSPYFENKYFSEVVQEVYKKLRAIIFALEVKCNNKAIIRLNPSDFVINNIQENCIQVYCIAPDPSGADKISTFEMSKDEIYKWYNSQQKQSKEDTAKGKDEQTKPVAEEEKSDFEYEENRNIDQVKIAGIQQRDDNKNSDEDDDSREECDSDSNGSQQEQNEEKGADRNSGFYMYDRPMPALQVTVSNIENSQTIRNHIIVCGIHSAMKNFIMPLRALHLKEDQIRKIVIIMGEPGERGGDRIDPAFWSSIARFEDIYLVNGSPLKQETLLRANLNFADKVVILGKDATLGKKRSSNVENSSEYEQMSDAEVIYIYKAIKQANKAVRIVTELTFPSNIQFLLPQNEPFDENNYMTSTLYATGEVYSSSIVDTLICQSYFNPHIVTIVQQILNGGSSEDEDEVTKQAMKAHPDLTQSILMQIPVPEECIGGSFEELFFNLLEKKLISMALYRLRNAVGNSNSYVYTNPDPDTIISHRDRVFVLGIELPEDIQGDQFEMMERHGQLPLRLGDADSEGPGGKQNLPEISKQTSLGESSPKNVPGAATLAMMSKVDSDDDEITVLDVKASIKNLRPEIIDVTKDLAASVSVMDRVVDELTRKVKRQEESIIKTVKEVTEEYLLAYKV